MEYLTLDDLINELINIRNINQAYGADVRADVGCGEYEVGFRRIEYLENQRTVMLYDSSYSEYAPGIPERQ